jgi:hypothetical protein
MWLFALTACGWDLAGRWNVDRVTVGDESVTDAGFLDLGSNNNHDYVPAHFLLAYWYDVAAGEFVPDPTPEPIDVMTGAEALRDAEDPVLELPFPIADDLTEPTFLPFPHQGGRSRLLEDPDFSGGKLVIELSR